MKPIRIVPIVFVLAACMFSTNPAIGQTATAEKPPLYTYVSEWTVPRSMWADYQKMEASGNDNLNKLVADGTLLGFGDYTIVAHQEGQATHGSWFQAGSMANLLKVLEGIRTAPDATSPVLVASKHWDYILESHDYNGHSGTFKNAYLRVGHWKYKAGASDPDGKIMKSVVVALLDKLLADGALHAYQIDEENIHTSDPNSFYMAIFTNGAEGLDKLSAALSEADKKNPAGTVAFGSLVDDQGHRDFLARVDIMNRK